jgi:integrase
VKHHSAIAVDDMPAVFAALSRGNGISYMAVCFTILTAVRAGETTGATWSEFDLEAGVWTIPGTRMKVPKDHRIPLSREALAIVTKLNDTRFSDYVFPGQRKGRPLSIASLSKALKAVAGKDATTHGCRSTFKDWASERTSFPAEVSEMALAHTVRDKVEAAYRRGELMKKRAAIMQAWAGFVTAPRKAGNVVDILRAAA